MNQSEAIQNSLGSIDEVASQMHRDSNHGGGNESQSAQTNFENVFGLMHDMSAAMAIGANGEAMSRTATSIISTKKELMDKIDLVSKTDSR